MLRAAWVADFGPQPAPGLFHQLQSPLTGFAALGPGGLIAAQQLHQCSSQLLGGTAGALALECMPVAIADAQLALQADSGFGGSVGPVLVPVVGPVAHAAAAMLIWGHPGASTTRL